MTMNRHGLRRLNRGVYEHPSGALITRTRPERGWRIVTRPPLKEVRSDPFLTLQAAVAGLPAVIHEAVIA